MVEAFISFLIFLIVIVVVAAILLWAVGKFLPELAVPARYLIGALALVVILFALLQVIRGQPIAVP